MLIQFESDVGHLKDAVAIAMEGIKYSPTSWLLNRDIARLKRLLGEPTTVVKGFFETAVRHNKSDLSLAVELGSFLFERGNYAEYTRLFRDIDLLPAAGNEKIRIRSRVRDGSALKRFKGTVKAIRGVTAHIALDPEGVDVFFWLSDGRLKSLRERDRVTCHLGFNSKGAIAFDVERA